MKKFPLVLLVFAALNAFAAPHSGEEFQLSQPDGSTVAVLVWGDEFHQDVESLDGYTLVRDADGWICYAELSPDGSEYVSTGVRYNGKTGISPVLQKNKRISKESFEKKHRKNREAVGFDNESFEPRDRRKEKPKAAPTDAGISPAPGDPEKWVGLTVLIDFPAGVNPRTNQNNNAVRSSVARQSVEDFANKAGGFNGGAGSVRDYYLDVSNGLLDYSNVVTDFVTVAYPKNYYDTLSNYQFVPELIQSALYEIKKRVESGQLDISAISTEGNNNSVVALNLLYAGSASQGWANGIWPHQGTYRAPGNASLSVVNGVVPSGTLTINVPAKGNIPAKNIRFSRYQLANLGTGTNPPGIGTFVHENGHMIMRWPDLYTYDETVTAVVGNYCVMGSSNGSNPQTPNPYFRSLAGWINVTDVTDVNDVLTSVANDHHAYQYRRNNQESYFIEARRRIDRSSSIAGEGLIVWHIHTSGQNTSLKSSAPYPLVKVVQANNAASTTVAFPSSTPAANAPFRNGGGSNNRQFHAQSSPPARYYDGTLSNIMLTEVSAINASANNMTFRIGTETAGTSSSSLQPSSSSSRPSSSSLRPSSSSSRPLSSSSSRPLSSSSSRPLSSSSSRPLSSSSSQPSSSSAALPSSSSASLPSSSSGTETPILLSRMASGNSVAQIHNGINLQATSDAIVNVYDLTGRSVLHMPFAPGVYTVSLGNLPKGMYIISARFGSEKIMRQAVVK